MSTDPVYFPRIRIDRGSEGQPSGRFTGKTMALSLLLLFLASLIGSFYLSQASHTATAGLEVVRLAEQRERIRQDNAELRTRIAEMEAVSNVKRRAEELGFMESDHTEYLIIDSPSLEAADQEASAYAAAADVNLSEPGSTSSRLERWRQEFMTRLDSWMNVQP